MSTKFNNLLIRTLVQLVRMVMGIKGLLTRFFIALALLLRSIGRRLLLPAAVRGYQLGARVRRALQPAERRFMLAVTHRWLLHIAVVGIAVMTAGGNLYAQGRDTVATGEGSILYQYLSGEDEVIEESGPPVVYEERYVADAAEAGSNDRAGTDDIGDVALQDEGSDTLIELGALMPEPSADGSGLVHRTKTETYTVVAGDTFSGISNKFGISIATILWRNKLTVRDFIKPGQQLIILPVSGVTHTVKSGDTIAKIAVTYKAAPDEIISWNNIADGATLVKGQELIVPGGRIVPVAAPVPAVKKLASPIDIFTKPPNATNLGTTDLLWPVPSHIITQYFGNWRPRVGRHTGLDIGEKSGKPIYAAEDGIVTHAGCGKSCRTGYGYYVDIDHGDGLATRYGHMSKVIATVGEQVRRGQVIGLIGSTGMSTGPHLHFEVRINGKYVNPLPYIK